MIYKTICNKSNNKRKVFGASGRTRTDTLIQRRILNPLRLPISSHWLNFEGITRFVIAWIIEILPSKCKRFILLYGLFVLNFSSSLIKLFTWSVDNLVSNSMDNSLSIWFLKNIYFHLSGEQKRNNLTWLRSLR